MENSTEKENRAASNLLGMTVSGDWKVIEKVTKSKTGTGGFFSFGYIVEKEDTGQQGFLKALDFSGIADADDWTTAMQKQLGIFNLERDILMKCKKHSLKKVVYAIDSGEAKVPGFGPILNRVPYLIFEKADGDIRRKIDTFNEKQLDNTWVLSSIHNSAAGLYNLHKEGIAHQDLKPSNILEFSDQNVFKITDMGRAVDKELGGFFKSGDMGYAPPETFYGYKAFSDFDSMKAYDIYLLGSLIFFHFQGTAISQLLWSKVTGINPNFTRSSFSQDKVLFQRAFGMVLDIFEESLSEIKEANKNELLNIVKELCNPDPSLRGVKKYVSVDILEQLSLEKYISKLALLSKKSEHGVL